MDGSANVAEYQITGKVATVRQKSPAANSVIPRRLSHAEIKESLPGPNK